MKIKLVSALMFSALILSFNTPVQADDKEVAEYVIIIKDHKFSPADIEIPAEQKVKLVIDNQDKTPEEFESHDLNKEKIINGNTKGTIFVGPLKPGTYKYFGEFNQATAQGTITAK